MADGRVARSKEIGEMEAESVMKGRTDPQKKVFKVYGQREACL